MDMDWPAAGRLAITPRHLLPPGFLSRCCWMPRTPDYPTSIRLTKDLKEFLLRQARTHKRPLSYQITWVLEEYCKAIEAIARRQD